MTHVTCRLTAKNRDQLRNPTLGNRVWATYTFYCVNILVNFVVKFTKALLYTDDCRLDQTLGKPGAWMVSGDNKEKQKMTVVARLSRIETQVGLLLLA